MKLLVDMNLSPSWVERLARHRFEAVHWSTIGAATAPDAEILTWAKEYQFVVITNDLDFSAILAASAGASPSVVQIRTQTLLSDVVGAVLRDALRGVTPVTYSLPGATAPCGAIARPVIACPTCSGASVVTPIATTRPATHSHANRSPVIA